MFRVLLALVALMGLMLVAADAQAFHGRQRVVVRQQVVVQRVRVQRVVAVHAQPVVVQQFAVPVYQQQVVQQVYAQPVVVQQQVHGCQAFFAH